MDMQTVQTFITGVGFPIVMCLIMAYYVKYINDAFTSQLEKIVAAFNAEIEANRDAINANHSELTKLITLVTVQKENDNETVG